mgnify:CR=1 FL=1
MIRRRRLIITPGPGRQLPDPEDPNLPQVAPRQPEAAPPLPPTDKAPAPDENDEPTRAGPAATVDAWLCGLGVDADPELRRSWLEPHLWAALRARVDANARERRARWVAAGSPPALR